MLVAGQDELLLSIPTVLVSPIQGCDETHLTSYIDN